MRKKPYTRAHEPPEFRESDFAGVQPRLKTELSDSLNRLSEQLAVTRQALQDISPSTGAEEAGKATAPPPASDLQGEANASATPPTPKTST